MGSKKDKKKKKKEHKKSSKKEKRKKSSSSDSSSSSESAKKKKKSKKGEEGKWGNSKVQEKWITKREKAIRQEEPNVSREEALSRAVAEYVRIFEEEKVEAQLPVLKGDYKDSRDDEEVLSGPTAEAVAEAERLAREEGEAAGKTAAQTAEEVQKARTTVLQAAESAGLYKAPNLLKRKTMFADKADYELAERKRLAAWMPSTGDIAEVQRRRNEAARS